MNEIILAADAASKFEGLGTIGYGLAAIGPGIGIGWPAAYHHVPGYRLY